MAEEESRAGKERWRVKREITVGEIITLITAIFAIVYAYNSLDKRVTVNEQSIKQNAQVNRMQDEAAVRAQNRSDTQFATIDRKLDQILLRELTNKDQR